MIDALEIPADLLSIRAAGDWIRGCLAERLTPDHVGAVAYTCELAIQEVLVNIVTHGYGDAPGSIRLSGEFTPDGETWRVVVEDDAAGYEPDALHDPDPSEPQEHGYGMMIVRQLTSEFSYVRLTDRNRTTLVFDLTTTPSS
jgi:serine/threonine-protein kinase RsbW